MNVLTLMLGRYTYLYIDIHIMSISLYISAYVSTYLGMTLDCMNFTYLFYVVSSTSMYVLRAKIYIFAHSCVNVISFTLEVPPQNTLVLSQVKIIAYL